jgi:hypothetical protein
LEHVTECSRLGHVVFQHLVFGHDESGEWPISHLASLSMTIAASAGVSPSTFATRSCFFSYAGTGDRTATGSSDYALIEKS